MLRARTAVTVLGLAAALAGCNGAGYLMGLRQDKADRTSFERVLARQPAGVPFAARGLLAEPWTRLWVFGDRATAQGIEDRTGVPFPRTEQPVVRGASYLVFVDGDEVRSAFTVVPGRAGSFTCLRASRPLTPATRLVVVPGAARAVVGPGAQARCGGGGAG